MPSIIARRRKDGTVGYTARIRIRRGKQILYEEAMTFSRLTPARDWARGRELELENPTVLNEARKTPVPFGKLIRWYRETFERVSNWKRTKTQHLRFLENHPLAATTVRELTTQSLIAHVRDRRTSGGFPESHSPLKCWFSLKSIWGEKQSLSGKSCHQEGTLGKIIHQTVGECKRCKPSRWVGRPRRSANRLLRTISTPDGKSFGIGAWR